MNIKRVAIQAFTSYDKLVQADDLQLDPECNLILGLNGCGKSNFLQAISFVLSDAFKNLSKQEKRAMLHEGASVSARQQQNQDVHTYFVEITLDNSTRRIPVEADTLTIRKSYNTQTDREDYLLNGKTIREKELHNLFESGGYSFKAQSQFQIIKQGQVQDLVQRGESSFLDMLKEVTGTKLLDEKLAKMQHALGDAETKKQALGQILSEIKVKLDSLQQDKEAYKEIEDLELQKKAFQKVLYQNKITGQQTNLDHLKETKKTLMSEREALLLKREKFLAVSSDQSSKTEQLRESLAHVENKLEQLAKLKQELQVSQIEAQGYAEQQKLQEDMSKNFEAEYGQQIKNIDKGIKELQKHAGKLENEIIKVQGEVDSLLASQAKLASEKDLLLMRKHLQEELQNNPGKRKKFFDEEISKIKLQVSQEQKESADCTKSLEIVRKNIQEMSSRQTETQTMMDTAGSQIELAQKQIEEARIKKREVATQVKEKLFKHNEADLKSNAIKTRLEQCQQQLAKLEPIYATLRRIEQVAKDRDIKGFRGLLIDYVDCKDQRVFPMVDVAAKTKLFSVLVDDLDTAQLILQINKEIKGGVIKIFTFETLDQVPLKQAVPYPANVKPLADYVTAKDQVVSKLVHNLFCKVVLSKDYETALQVAKQNDLTCITPSMQIVYSGAFITKVGANQSPSSESRLSLYQQIAKLKNSYLAVENEKEAIAAEQDSLSNADLDALRKLQKCELTLNRAKDDLQTLKTTRFELNAQLNERDRKRIQLEEQIARHTDHIDVLEAQEKALQKEKVTVKTEYSEMDKERLIVLNKEINVIGLQARDKMQRLEMLKSQKEQQISIMQDSFLRNQTSLDTAKQAMQIDVSMIRAQASVDKDAVSAQLALVNKQITETVKEYNDLKALLSADEKNVTSTFDETEMQQLRAKTSEVEEIGNKIDEILRVCGDIEQQIVRLGRCDESLVEKLKVKPLQDSELKKKIHEILQELEKYPRKNRHSQEWYEKYYSKFCQLTQQTESVDQTQSGIKTLLQNLDNQKQKAIEENFIQLNSNFKEIFARIVQGGSAELKLVKQDVDLESQKSHPSQFPDGSQDPIRFNQKVYKGVKVSVDFGIKVQNPPQDQKEGQEPLGLNHLSGGQKTVVVVALIFAVLKMEAAPFYILDEFDHALDAQYRKAIADLIKQLSPKSQFLITTFKTDLVETLDDAKLFEVTFKNKTSRLEVIDKARALSILKDSEKN